MRFRMGLLLSLLCLASFGCQNKVADERDALYRQVRELQGQKRQLEAERDARVDPGKFQEAQATIAQRDQQIADLQNQLRQPQPGAPANDALAGLEVTKDEKAGTATVTVPGAVLLAPGTAEVKESAKA